jgi:hypothetical protein
MPRWCWPLLVLFLACDKGRSTDTRSAQLATAAERVRFLCAYAVCPAPAIDARFHLVFHDNSRGLLAGPDDLDLRAVMRVEQDVLERWTRGCQPARVEARPSWLDEVTTEARFVPTSAPDGYRCGAEMRAVHVRDGLVVRRIVPGG